MRTDRRTDMTKQIVAFLKFTDAPKTSSYKEKLSSTLVLCVLNNHTGKEKVGSHEFPKMCLTLSRLMIYIYIYICRTAPLTSRSCILYIYSTNIGTEYFKLAAHSPFFLFKMPFIS